LSDSDLGSRLLARRHEQKLSLRAAAEEIGVSFNTLSRVERGHMPSGHNKEAIMSWLGASGIVASAVEEDLLALPVRAGTAGLRAAARVLADVLDSDAPATAQVQASKTLTDVLVRLAGPARGASGGGDAVERIRGHP
jgi:transcriptional regulator with XRE-family HTH domain